MVDSLAHAVNALNQDFIRYHPREATPVVAQMKLAEIAELLESLPINQSIEHWGQLPADIAGAVLEKLKEELVARFISRADSVKTAQMMMRLAESQRTHLMTLLSVTRQRELEGLMSFRYGSAGALMDVNFPRLQNGLNVREALMKLKKQRPTRFSHTFYILDQDGHPQHIIELQDLAFAESRDMIEKLVKPIRAVVLPTASREEVVEKFEKYKLADLPVIDIQGKLVGVIHQDTLVTAIREESSADLLTMVGVSTEERALSKTGFVVRKRLPWLQINLVTAFIAASVVGLFENTIAQFTALAVLLPVVAGQSGNTGAQALAVTMRALALREISTSHWWRVARKEISAGFINGIAVALTTALGVYIWSGSNGLALVICIAMVISMVIAGFVGVIIPILLSALGQDPAQSSSIILTTVTDVAGFFSFLGIATVLSGML